MENETTKSLLDDGKDQADNQPTNDAKLQKIYKELSQEAQQDRDSIGPTKSFLEGIDSALFIEREREYKDPEKHWIRIKVWLEKAKEIAKETQNKYQRGIRYFTLPGYYRLDVSLLLRENLLDVIERAPDGSIKKVYVAAFESEPTKYARMIGHFPEFRLFGDTSVEDALTDTKNTYYDELLRLFPFDLVNLDLTTTLTPKHEGPYSKIMKAIDAVFKRQADYGSKWALFLTFRNMPDEWEENTLEQLFDNLQSNLDDNPRVLEAFDKRYHHTQVRKVYREFPKQSISQAVTKWLVDRANANNLHLESMGCYYYQRPEAEYDIYKLVMVFSKGTIYPGIVPTKGTTIQSWMIDDLVKCINQHKSIDVVEKILLTLNNRPTFEAEIKDEIDSLCKLIG